jgi:hypothetical protein
MKPTKQLSAMTLPLAFAAACADEAGHLGEEAASLAITSATFVETAGVPDEHGRVATARLATWTPGRQLLLSRGPILRGMCTVDATGHLAGDDIVALGLDPSRSTRKTKAPRRDTGRFRFGESAAAMR